MSQTVRPTRRRTITPQMVLLIGLLVALVGTPFYIFVRHNWTGGITDRGEYKEVDLKAMGNFEFDPISGGAGDIPPRYRGLDGQRVLLVGEMYAPDEAGDRISQFQLVYSIQKCCFNGPPRVQERVFAKVPGGGKVDAYPPGVYVRVLGRLHVTLARGDDNQIVKVYELDVEKVEPNS